MAATATARRQPNKALSADVVRINVAGTRYSVVRTAAKELGMVVSDDSGSECNVYWIDGAVPLEKYLELRSYQRINHFPGMGEISRKDALARNVQRMKKENRGEYHFFPTTWVLPADHGALAQHMTSLRRRKQRKTFIVKPYNSSMGNGINLTHTPDSINPSERVIVQEYIEKPFLLDGFKCDLRIYVLVTSCNPLRLFVFKDGLVRLSTEQYSPPNDHNLEQYFMHLTNYSVNKHSTLFDADEREDRGSKRTLHSFFSWLKKSGYNVTELWNKIYDVIIKTILLAYPHLLHSYSVSRHGQSPDGKSQFFEILGFDILLDHTLQPWVLEVNRSPSFGTEADLDINVKTAVIRDALSLANISSLDKQTVVVSQRQASRRRLVNTKSRISHSRLPTYDFQGEQKDAATEKEHKRIAAKERLSQLRRERKMEEFERENKGDYVRVYPTSDTIKSRLYSRLMEDSLIISTLGRCGTVHSSRSGRSLGGRVQLERGRGSGRGQTIVRDMDEHELVDLLSQYEDNESGITPSWHSAFTRRPSTTSFQSLALQDSSSIMSNMHQVMTARLYEEEQTQRTMVALHEIAPFYPGKAQTEVHAVLQKIREDFLAHRANIGSFWLVSLDNIKRKQLLAPISEAVNCLLHSHWRRVDLSNIRLHRITSHLMEYLLERRGERLWSTIITTTTTDKNLSWEASFKKKHKETLSVAEMKCCRRIVELSHSILYCAYHYHCLLPRSKHKLSTSGLSATKRPSLPHLKRQLSLTTPTMPRPPPSRHRSLTVIRSNTTSRRLKPSINNTTLIS